MFGFERKIDEDGVVTIFMLKNPVTGHVVKYFGYGKDTANSECRDYIWHELEAELITTSELNLTEALLQFRRAGYARALCIDGSMKGVISKVGTDKHGYPVGSWVLPSIASVRLHRVDIEAIAADVYNSKWIPYVYERVDEPIMHDGWVWPYKIRNDR